MAGEQKGDGNTAARRQGTADTRQGRSQANPKAGPESGDWLKILRRTEAEVACVYIPPLQHCFTEDAVARQLREPRILPGGSWTFERKSRSRHWHADENRF